MTGAPASERRGADSPPARIEIPHAGIAGVRPTAQHAPRLMRGLSRIDP
jgi:hypothetical protein